MSGIFNSVDELPDSALGLLREVGERDYFQGLDWLRIFCAHGMAPDAEPLLIVANDSPDSSGKTAMLGLRRPSGQAGSEIAGWWGCDRGASGLTSYQSVRFGLHLPADSGSHARLTRQLVAMLVANDAPVVIDLSHLEPGTPGIEELCDALEAQGYSVRHYTHNQNLYEQVAGQTFSEFLANRPSQVRSTYARKARQLDRKKDCRISVQSSATGLEPALTDYESVLTGSWKDPEPFPEFTGNLIRAAAAAGVLRLGLLYVDGTPVAAQVWIVTASRATIYKLHYLQAFAREAVGSVLCLKMIQHMLETERVEEIDFGVGDESHKRLWLAQTRSLNGILAFKKSSAVGRVLELRYSGRALLRNIRSRLRIGISRG